MVCKEQQPQLKTFYRVFITFKVNGHVMSPFIIIYYSPFLWTFIHLEILTYAPIFDVFITLVSINDITYIHSLACVFIFYLCLMSNLLAVTYEYYVGSCFGHYNYLLLAEIILFNPCLMCDRMAIIY